MAVAFSADYFACALRSKMVEQGMGPFELSLVSGVSLDSIMLYETNIIPPSFEEACQLADALRCSLDELILLAAS